MSRQKGRRPKKQAIQTHQSFLLHRIGFILLACGGGICLLCGIVLLIQGLVFKAHASEAIGQVISIRESSVSVRRESYIGSQVKEQKVWIPVIRFQTAAGLLVVFDGIPFNRAPASSSLSHQTQTRLPVESYPRPWPPSSLTPQRRNSVPGCDLRKEQAKRQPKTPENDTPKPRTTPSPNATAWLPDVQTVPAPLALPPADHKAEYVGDLVKVLYDPRDPMQARINDPVDLWFFTAVWLVVGIMLAGSSLWLATKSALSAQRAAVIR